MPMTSRVRKLALASHLISSVGWAGTVACFFVLAVIGSTSKETQTVIAIYITMDLIYRIVILPLCLVSLTTGIMMSLGTEWGFIRYYWLIIKLLISIISTVGLFLHVQPIRFMADEAKSALSSSDHHIQIQLVIISGAALIALLVATVLSLYKPRGITAYGWRKQTKRQKLSDIY